jgi:large subunit ribosomal protein L18
MNIEVKTLRKKNLKVAMRVRRKVKVRKKIEGSIKCPRLSIFRSAAHIYVQAIDDVAGKTLAAASTVDKDLRGHLKDIKKSHAAALVGELLGKRLKEKGILTAVFDRNGFRYCGRVAAVAQGAREAGLNF